VIYKLPLSKFVLRSTLINAQNNLSVILPPNIKANHRYYAVCVASTTIMSTPIEINLALRTDLVSITGIYPNFMQPTKFQMKGFKYKCSTQYNLIVEWRCPTCSTSELQNVTYISAKKDTQILEIISDKDNKNSKLKINN